MLLDAGHRLGPYEIISPIGAGGMGEVYRARDTRLQRTVAIKILPPEQSTRATRRERFELEARAISSLSHPHICSLFDVGEASGLRFLVMEHLEGETLQTRLKRGRLPIPEAIALAIQIGDALDHAHRRGLVHRDLNPSNIMLLKPHGTEAKLLDFGLAKMVESSTAAEAAVGASRISTETRNITAEGMIVGTFQYMAPEQLEGKEATARTDIFAFGCVLYEMTTGRRAFSGGSRASLISAILKDDPSPISTTQSASPPALDRVIRKCLAKDSEARWQTARDLVDELKWIGDSMSQPVAAASTLTSSRRPASRITYAWIGWALASLLAIALASLLIRPRELPSRTQFRAEVALPDKLDFREYNYPVLSPDGTPVVLGAGSGGSNSELLIRKLDSLEIQRLSGTDDAMYPFWSPDSRSIAFFANGKLKKVELSGGSPSTITPASGGLGGSWNRDGTIVFSPRLDAPLERVNDSGGLPAPVSHLDAERHQTSQLFPDFLPDGRHFLFYGISAGREDEFNAAYVGSLDSPKVTPLFRTNGRIEYAAPGYVLSAHGDSLMAQPFDAARLRPHGEAVLIAEHVRDMGALLGSSFSEANGSIAYRSGSAGANLALTWLSRKGATLSTLGPPSGYGDPALSPDGKTLAFDYRESSALPRDIWLMDLARGTKSRLTFDPADEFNPIWSPDGTRIAFTSVRKGPRNIYQKLVSGAGSEQPILESPQEKNVEDWSPDGTHVVFNTRVPGQPIEIWAVALTGGGQPFRVAYASGSCEQARFSPDGKWIAYRSMESGKFEIYVQEFPPAGGKWQVSNAGGSDPEWAHDGRAIYYIQGTRLMTVAVNAAAHHFSTGVPGFLFDVAPTPSGHNAFVPSPDGQKFLFGIPSAEKTAARFTVLTNWAAGLKK